VFWRHQLQEVSRKAGKEKKAARGLLPLKVEELETRDLLSSAYHFEFGTTATPVAAGYTLVTPSTSMKGGASFGWQKGTIYGLNTGIGAPPTEALDYTGSGNFSVKLPNGTYNVTLTVGDPTKAHNNMAYSLQGTQVASVSTLAGQSISKTFTATVSNGMLQLGLKGLDSTNPNAVVQAVDITPPPPTATFGNSGPVNEGSTAATVSFTNPVGGSGGYTYSYDFGNTGTFQIVNSTAATATVPESYVDDGPLTLVVHGRITDSAGNHSDFLTSITVNDPPPVATLSGPTSGLPGSMLTFTASAADGSKADTALGFAYAWNFGDGTTASGVSVSHTYATAGTFTVTLTATADGESGTATASVAIVASTGAPTATFSNGGPVNEGATTATVSCTNPAGGSGGYTYSYDFGNTGTFEIANSASATATVPESYVDDGSAVFVVHGRITDSAGHYSDYTTSITVYDPPPTASISGPTSGLTGSALSFTASASDGSQADKALGFTYAWNFGDGTTASGASVSHTYTTAGTFTVTLTATADGESGTATASAAIVASTGAPTATFSNSGPVNEGATTATVSFTNPAGGSGGYTYSYDFGNTGTFEIANSASATATVPESYVDDGSAVFVVHGRITDSTGHYSDYTTSITVYDPPPTASISGPTSGLTGSALAFTASASDGSQADKALGFTYAWNFGDGTTAAGASVSHAYASAGAYTVTLTATTDGESGTATASVAVVASTGAPTATFSNSGPVNEGATTATVSFTNPAGGSGGYTYSYDFGNTGTFQIANSASATATVPESYVDDGPATVVVHGRITDSAGHYSDYTTSITVNNPPPVATISGPASGLTGAALAFTASATDGSQADTALGFTYAWNFGDGTTASGASVSHAYASAGAHTVTLTATADGEPGTATASVAIVASTGAPTATFSNSGPVTEGSTTATVSFTNPAGGSGGYTYSYDFGNTGAFQITNSTSATATVPEGNVNVAGANVVVRGRITDSAGSYTDYTTSITVTYAPPTVSFTYGASTGTSGLALDFVAYPRDPNPANAAGGFTYAWNFGDGSTATGGPAVSHTYATAGSYAVTVTATDSGASATATATVNASAAVASSPTLMLQSFDGTTVPLNGDGSAYPNTADTLNPVSLDSTNSVSGTSLHAHITEGSFVLQFNPYNYAATPGYPVDRGFARDYSFNPTGWQYNTYNRMSFWIYLSPNQPWYAAGANANIEIGTYVKQLTNSDPTSDEYGGNHYYHMLNVPAVGAWTQVILNMHPDHLRGDPGSTDPGVVPYPSAAGFVNNSGLANGGDDSASTYDYFDALTRFYIGTYSPPSGYSSDYWVNNIQFFNEPYQENDAQVYSLTGTYTAASNQLIVTWNRDKADVNVSDEVRYSFTDIHQTGWAAATAAPNGLVTPTAGSGPYNTMIYNTSALPLVGHSVVYIAIKPQNSDLFTEIEVPLGSFPLYAPTPPPGPAVLTQAHFDFGPTSSPVPAGYVAVGAQSGFSPRMGYGWVSTAGLDARDRGTGVPLTSDFVFGTDATFQVSLANGTYTVTPTLGDADYAMSSVSIWANGQQVASGLSTGADQFTSPSFTVTVTNGLLDLRFANIVGGYFSLDALTITPV
jgi:PKD repeat protein